MLGGNQAMIDLVFEASIAEVMDDYFRDQRLHDAFFGGGVIGTWAGPRDKGTASVKLMHHQGDLDGGGSNWAYVEGGMGMVSFAIADAAREAGAVLACGVPVASITPGEGVELEDGTRIRASVVISNADPKVAMRLIGREAIDSFDRGFGERLDAWDVRSPGRQVQRRPRRAPELDGGRGRELAGPRDDRADRRDRFRSGRIRELRGRRARGRLRRGLHADRLRSEPGAPRASIR